jgi:ABC-type glycerol-3-phosphate transport system substrate-binding protein
MKKTITALLILAAVLAAGLLGACGNTDTGTDSGTGERPAVQSGGDGSGEPAQTEKQFVDADYGGEDFTVYMRSHTVGSYKVRYVTTEEGTDIVSEASTSRNRMVEEKYRVNLVFREVESPQKTLKTDIAGEQVDYDIMICQRNTLSSSATDGLLYDFYSLENVDLTSKWWDANALKAYTMGGRVFIMPNDVSVANVAACRAFFFSKGVLEDYNLKSPYQFVKDNEWTLDNFLLLARSVKNDAAEGTLGTYGMLAEPSANRNFMVTGCGIPWVGRDADGKPVICVAEEGYIDRLDLIAEKLNSLLNDPESCITYSDANTLGQIEGDFPNSFARGRALFAQDHFLFTQTTMDSSSDLVGMTRGFGIVMNPKFNSDQEEYVEKIDNNSALFCIPNSVQVDKKRVAAVMDYWGYVSSTTTMEAYYELTMKTKRASDAETAEMLDTIKDTIGYYISDLYTIFNPVDTIISAVFSGSSAASAAASQKRPIQSTLRMFNDYVTLIETSYKAVEGN